MEDYLDNLKLYWVANSPKFLGVLKGYELSILDESLIKLLINKEVYIKDNRFLIFGSWDEEHDSNSIQYNKFGHSIAYKPYYYYFNPLIFKETFLLCKWYIDSKTGLEYDFSDDLAFKVASKIDKKAKIKYLKKQYKKYFPDDEEFTFYSIIVDSDENTYGVQKYWYEKFCEIIGGTNHESFLGLYVTYSNSNLPLEEVICNIIELTKDLDWEFEEFIEQWETFSVVELILEEILLKIEEISNPERRIKTFEEGYGIIDTKEDTKEYINLSALETAYYCFYMSEANDKFTVEPFPSEKAYIELSEKFNVNAKNIQVKFNDIRKNVDVRLQYSRKAKIEKGMKLLTSKAKIIAENELKKVILNS